MACIVGFGHTSCDSYESLYSGMMVDFDMVSQVLVLHWDVAVLTPDRGLYVVKSRNQLDGGIVWVLDGN